MTQRLIPFKNKSPKMAATLAGYALGGKDPREGYCAFCGEMVDQDEFHDKRSRREYEISALCQVCQDKVFKAFDLEEDE